MGGTWGSNFVSDCILLLYSRYIFSFHVEFSKLLYCAFKLKKNNDSYGKKTEIILCFLLVSQNTLILTIVTGQAKCHLEPASRVE